ncbi:flavodoxin [Vibrio rotiferianus]|jgi:hypothetical protein|uniref:flavodoxin n=1 Tax=Vibrio rotiferianus TaxID=190895 RepID=UPI00406A5475
MNEQQLTAVNKKNDWLYNLVEVEFPTPESIKGRELYLEASKACEFSLLDSSSLLSKATQTSAENIYLVDFHRLTIMFALLQSSRWEHKEQQDLIIEFLTQIILSSEYELYVGFHDGEPTAAAIVSQYEKQTLISDVVVSQNLDKQNFVGDLAKKLAESDKLYETIIAET